MSLKTGKKRKLEQSLEEINSDRLLEPELKRRKLSPPPSQEEKSVEECTTNGNETTPPSITDTNNKEVNDEIKQRIMKQWGEESDKITDIRYLEEGRIAVYTLKNELFEKAVHILSVEYREEDIDRLHEKVVVMTQENEIINIELEDKIMLNSIPISEGVEYTFSENGTWFVGDITSESVVFYRKSKFKTWKKTMMDPECEAAFKRLLRIGLITNMFDRFVFESPENEKKDYIVKNENGKNVDIPRPVHKLRKWNVETREYVTVECRLDGAPDAKDADQYWRDMVDGFRKKFGCQYVDNLLESFKTK